MTTLSPEFVEARQARSPEPEAMLTISGLDVEARAGRNRLQLLEGVDLTVLKGRCTAVIGESGSGKSTLLKSILRTGGPRVKVSGSVVLDGREIGSLDQKDFAPIRGNQIALVAQNALAALDPFYAVGDQIAYLARRHGGLSRAEAKQRALDLLNEVALADPERNFHALPHELSGGMRQRCVLAMALACEPQLLLADEPTTALDVITQDRALALLASIQRSHGMSMIFVTHDIGVAATVADDVVVLYGGRVVERGPVFDVLTSPSHPYTQGLVAANRPPVHGERWQAISGEPPRPGAPIQGCAFAPRCAEASDLSRTSRPQPVAIGATMVSCHARGPSVTPQSPQHGI